MIDRHRKLYLVVKSMQRYMLRQNRDAIDRYVVDVCMYGAAIMRFRDTDWSQWHAPRETKRK